ncbi:MAG: hypothetical protein V1705_02010 [bacterium]
MNHALALNPSSAFPLKIKLKFSFKAFWLISLLSALPLLFFYVFGVNSLAREQYLLREQQRSVGSLARENEALEIEFSNANSLANLGGILQNEKFEFASKIKYIKILESQMVRK